MSEDLRLVWSKSVCKQIQMLTEKFKNVYSDEERLKLCWEAVRRDTELSNIVGRIKREIKTQYASHITSIEQPSEVVANRSEDEEKSVLPALAKGNHPKISNGSALIQLNCSESQGRYLEAKEKIKAGDVLIMEKPYAAVLQRENQDTHCSHCFKMLDGKTFPCQVCELKYCCERCRREAWRIYHKKECFLKPLLEMLEISSHLALRLILVTGTEKLSKFVQDEKVHQSKEFSYPDLIPGCTSTGLYPGDYGCVYSLVTNTELQPTEAIVSYALDSAFITDIAFDYIFGTKKSTQHDGGENLNENSCSCSSAGITKEVVGCLLLHHMQQMPCNIHAITAVVVATSDHSKTGVMTKEQKRIAAGIYPTASLMNHACDPDVIVSFLGRSLVVRATHNIQPREEIAHCYGPSASRMTREMRQSLLQKQYFFTCRCSACKSDEDLEEQHIYAANFLCQKCSHSVVISRENGSSIGKCRNSECGRVKDFSSEIEAVKDTHKLFNHATKCLEDGDYPKCVGVLKECLKKREKVLQKYDKDVAETHDALARCYASLGDFRQASFHCEQSTESVRRRFGQESVEYAHELHKFSQLLFNARHVTKANSVIDNAVRLLSVHYGGQYSEVGELLEMKRTLKDFLKVEHKKLS